MTPEEQRDLQMTLRSVLICIVLLRTEEDAGTMQGSPLLSKSLELLRRLRDEISAHLEE